MELFKPLKLLDPFKPLKLFELFKPLKLLELFNPRNFRNAGRSETGPLQSHLLDHIRHHAPDTHIAVFAHFHGR